MKKSTLIAVVVLSFLVVVYMRQLKKDKKKKSLNDEVSKAVNQNSNMNNYEGDKNYQNTGIHIFQPNFKRKTFGFLAMMDDESLQGKFEWDAMARAANRAGHFEASNGWRAKYRALRSQKGHDIAIVEIVNPVKGYRERKTVNFTTETITR